MDFFKQGNPSGLFSWQHLLICAIAWAILLFFAIFFGIKDRKTGKNTLNKNIFLLVVTILMWAGELSKYIVVITTRGWADMYKMLPFYLCNLQLYTLPLMFVTKGNFKKAMADLTFIFGLIGAVGGTFICTEFIYNYAFSFYPLSSVFTHTMAGMASLYIGVANLFTLTKDTIKWTAPILFVYSCIAWVVALITKINYMFMLSSDGTPFAILYNLVNGNKVLYPLSVILLQICILLLFYLVVFIIRKCISKKHNQTKNQDISTEA